ncbi:MAG: phenylalanine--tRNA ligase subunit beta [Pseudomonadota bacterium]
MKFTLGWLKDHLETDASLDQILEALTDLGLEVEGVEDPAETLGAFSICRVIEARQHPNADRLRVCRVEAWLNGPDKPSEEVQVVCGAPNARTGLVGVFAAPGTFVPGTELLLKPGEIRGEASNGMLCSERELMISEDHDGIIDLPSDAPLGRRFIDYAGLNDPTIEIAITPNRPDALGVRGVARDLAARGLGTLKPDEIAPVPGAFPCPIGVKLAPEVRAETEEQGAACPLFVGRLIRNVKNGPAPDWMRKRLQAIGLRPINALVDVTNYLTYDRARPLHVFDAAKVEGAIKVRFSKPGETLEALDGKTYEFDDAMTMICDRGGRRVEAIGGVMGGEPSGCTEETTDVFIEAAYFDPVRTAATGRKLKIHSDARYRFERGVDPEFAEAGMELATRLILDLCGGEPSELVIAGKPPKNGRNGAARKFKLDTERVESLVGMTIPREDQIRILTDLGFTVSNERQKAISVAVPPWRPDVHGEADLVEEVARITSLAQLKARPMPRPNPGVSKPLLTPMQRRLRVARRALAEVGLSECVTYSFIQSEDATLFGGGGDAMALENPISSEMTHMRPSPLPALLRAAARNQARGFADVALFEIGPGFSGSNPGDQTELAAAIRVGATAPRDWSGARRPVDLYDAKADAEALLAAIGAPVDRLMIDRDVPDWLHPGRAGRLKLGPKTPLALFGELHPKVVKAMGLKGAAVAALLMVEDAPFPKAKTKARPPLTLHELQAVERDFAFVLDADIEAETVLKAARSADKKLITDAIVFDVLDGGKAAERLGEGKKSLAISVRLQPTDKTLTDEEIEAVGAKVVAAVEKASGGVLRG